MAGIGSCEPVHMPKAQFRFLSVAAIVTTVVVLTWAVLRVRPGSQPVRQAVTVSLFGSATKIVGLKVEREAYGPQTSYLDAEGDLDVSVVLPDEKVLRLSGRRVSVIMMLGFVTDVSVTPLREALPYKDAVAKLVELLGEFGIPPDAAIYGDIANQWPADAADFDPIKRPGYYPLKFRASMAIRADFGIGVVLFAPGDGGWAMTITFASIGEGRQLLLKESIRQQSTSAPTTQERRQEEAE